MTAWRTSAEAALDALAATGETFTADDLLRMVGPPDLGHTPNGRNNVIGAMFQQAHRCGRITAAGYTQSTSPTRNGGVIRVWRGLA